MNIDIHEQAMGLLVDAQSGNKFAQEDLIVLIRDKYMMRRVSRYINKNRQVDNEDIKQEFLIGVGSAIQTAKMDIGDPIEHIIAKGIYSVRSYFRSMIVKGTIQVCDDCGNKSRVNRIAPGVYQCKKCGSLHVTVSEINDHNETLFDTMKEESFEEDLIAELRVSDFKSTLTPGTNVHTLYELLIEKCIDRDNPLVKNYISEIAKEMGGTSNQNVVQCLKKLKKRLQQWIADNDTIMA